MLGALFEHMLGPRELAEPREVAEENLRDDIGSSFCATWRWRAAGDLLVIDNATMLHRATTAAMAAGAERRMLRVSVRGGAPVGAEGPD